MTYLDVLTHTSFPEQISKTTGPISHIGNMTVIGRVVFEICNIIVHT